MESADQGNNKSLSLSLIAEYGSDSDSEYPEVLPAASVDCEDEMSEMVLKNNIINACAHGPLSASRTLEDDEDTTRHMIIDSADSAVLEYEVTEYRDLESSDSDSSSSSDSSDSDVDSVKDVEEVSSRCVIEQTINSGKDDRIIALQIPAFHKYWPNPKNNFFSTFWIVDETELGQRAEKLETPKVPGELGLDELPPIEDLTISIPPQETTKIGTVASIVDRFVIVSANPETPAVDLDSVLFLDNGAKALGKVFDVFGPVTEPNYCVRFNSIDHIKERGVEPGMDVFIAPRTPHTNFVFLGELMKLKGSDASWLNDVEPPPSQIEYSDDEEERRAKKQHKQRNNPEEADTDSDRARRARPARPVEYNSRFGGGPSRGRNPFGGRPRAPRHAPPLPPRPPPLLAYRFPPPHFHPHAFPPRPPYNYNYPPNT